MKSSQASFNQAFRNACKTEGLVDITPSLASPEHLSTMEDWYAFDECMNLGARNCYQVHAHGSSGWYCTALHEDPENLPYSNSWSHFGREIYEHSIDFNVHPDHLEFQDGVVLMMPPEEDGWRELRPAANPDQETGIYWTVSVEKGKEVFYIEER